MKKKIWKIKSVALALAAVLLFAAAGPAYTLASEPAVSVTGLKAKAVSDTKIKLSWARSDADSYEVQRSKKATGGFQTIAKPTANTFTDQKLNQASSCYYRVRGIKDGQAGAYCEPIKGSTLLSAVKKVEIIRYSTTSLKVQWDKNSRAKYYQVYRKDGAKGKYRRIKTTSGTHYRDKNLKNNTTYYYKVRACLVKKGDAQNSSYSPAKKMKTKTFSRTTLLVGDSIMSGMTVYRATPHLSIGGKKKVMAEIGLGMRTLRTKGVLNKIIRSKPYRVYIMLGMNEISYRKPSAMISDYRKIIKDIQKKSPDTDIVLLPVSPVSHSKARQFSQIGSFNRQVKKLAKTSGVKYCDYTSVLKDKKGYLKYNGGDGVHWSPTAYRKFAKKLTAFDKAQDK